MKSICRHIDRGVCLAAVCLLLTVAAVILACGGGGSSSPGSASQLQSGVFFDSPVQGMEYSTESLSGTTDANGQFKYLEGETVKFSLGGIQIGDALKARPTVTVVDLVPGAADATNPKVQNIAAFLQSLDTGGNLTVKIVIPPAAVTAMSDLKAQGKTINFDAAPNAFNADASALAVIKATGKTQMRSATDASAQLGQSLANLIATYAGDYSGTLGGGDSGTWQIAVTAAGAISGTVTGSSGPDTVKGKISANGTAVMGSSAGGATFTGTLDLSGNIKGTWVNAGTLQQGSFTGGEKGVTPVTTTGSSSVATTVPPTGSVLSTTTVITTTVASTSVLGTTSVVPTTVATTAPVTTIFTTSAASTSVPTTVAPTTTSSSSSTSSTTTTVKPPTG